MRWWHKKLLSYLEKSTQEVWQEGFEAGSKAAARQYQARLEDLMVNDFPRHVAKAAGLIRPWVEANRPPPLVVKWRALGAKEGFDVHNPYDPSRIPPGPKVGIMVTLQPRGVPPREAQGGLECCPECNGTGEEDEMGTHCRGCDASGYLRRGGSK